jgi:predicted TIM-barrel fold metal-dependent hydrolase
MRLFDSHAHVIDPRFPLVANDGFLPAPFTAADYLARAAPLGVLGGAVVSGSFQGFDQTYLRDALRTLGPAFVGVTQLPATASDDEVLALDAAGVRGVRFNLRRGGSAGLAELDALARRVHALAGWHAELYVDGRHLAELEGVLATLPRVVVDHLGLSRAGIPALLRLVGRGVLVKATGFGRLDFDPAPVLRAVADANPHALLVGTDLPSTRSPRPFAPDDLRLVADALGGEHTERAQRALWRNAVALYRPPRAPDERAGR